MMFLLQLNEALFSAFSLRDVPYQRQHTPLAADLDHRRGQLADQWSLPADVRHWHSSILPLPCTNTDSPTARMALQNRSGGLSEIVIESSCSRSISQHPARSLIGVHDLIVQWIDHENCVIRLVKNLAKTALTACKAS